MADITAAKVNELRQRTGVGIMDCKVALVEAGGDVDKAVDLLRKKGQAKQDKLASRQATEGRVGIAVSGDGQLGVMVEINCNTDFTGKSGPVVELAKLAADTLVANPEANVAEAAAVQQAVTRVVQQTGENVRVGRSVVLRAPAGGRVGQYLYVNSGKIGVLMALVGDASADLLDNLGGHIAWRNPLAQTRQQLPAELVAKEREIAVEQAKATGKPQAIAEKIAEGKLQAFYAEHALMDQEFMNPEYFKGTIAAMLKAKGVTLHAFVRLGVGQ